MTSVKFIAALPKPASPHDVLILKFSLLANAEEFSVNFCNDTCRLSLDISYHFKWLLKEEVIVENCKKGDEWQDENVIDFKGHPGKDIHLEFIYGSEGIFVYTGGNSHITYYATQFELSQIKSVQLWGDIEHVGEIAFVYKNQKPDQFLGPKRANK